MWRRAFCRRAALTVPAVVVGAPIAHYGVSSPEQRLTISTSLLSARRALRAGGCLCELTLHYKVLSWRHGGDEEAQRYEMRRAEVHAACAQRVLRLCRNNGGLFTKIGQHATTLRPALPDEYVEALAELQDQAPSRALGEVEAVLRAELGLGHGVALVGHPSPFAEFDEEPVGSASLAQVHRARLHDGTEVAVKVRHGDIEDIVRSDLFIMRWLDWAAGVAFTDFSMAWAIEQFSANVVRELDFRQEADNAEHCHELLARCRGTLSQRVLVPRVRRDLSSSRLLTMDFAHGVPISALVDAVKKKAGSSAGSSSAGVAAGEEMRLARFAPEVALCLVEAFAAMFFALGFVHCDPHPGNLLVALPPPPPPGLSLTAAPLEHETGARLVLLDHGLYHEISEASRLANCGLWKAMVLQDAGGVARHCASMGIDEQTAALLPLYFTNRSSGTRAGLGQPISAAQKAELNAQLAHSGIVGQTGTGALAGLGGLAERLPADMLFVMRTMHLVANLHRGLGGTPSARFRTYARAAAEGEWDVGASASQNYRGNPRSWLGCWTTLVAVGHGIGRRLSGICLSARLWLYEVVIWASAAGDTTREQGEQFSIAQAIAESIVVNKG